MHYYSTSLTLFLITFCSIMSSVQSACAKFTDFITCANVAGFRLANCNSLVVNIPTIEFYECQCTEYQASIVCYDLCTDSVELQAQKNAQLKQGQAVCNQVTILKNQGFGGWSPSPSPTLTTKTRTTKEGEEETSTTTTYTTPTTTTKTTFIAIVGIKTAPTIVDQLTTTNNLPVVGGGNGNVKITTKITIPTIDKGGALINVTENQSSSLITSLFTVLLSVLLAMLII